MKTSFDAGSSKADSELLRHVLGKGQFLCNNYRGTELHATFVRSAYAHARLLNVNTNEAKAIEGVRAVLTGKDLSLANVGALPVRADYSQSDGSPMAAPPRYALADGLIRFVGEPIAIVIAETLEIAKHACSLVDIEVETLESVVDVSQAIQENAPALWPLTDRNVVASSEKGDREATTLAMSHSPHRLQFSITHPRLAPSSMETRCCLAEPSDDGSITLHLPSQNPATVQAELAEHVLNMPLDRVRVVVDDIGGSFGLKGYCYPEYAAVAFAAMRLKRSIRWEADRMEDQLAGSHGRDQAHEVEVGYNAEGKLLALQMVVNAAVGAYLTPPGAALGLSFTSRVITSVYSIPAAHIVCRAVLTNTSPIGPYRGAGRPEGVFAIETALDLIARRLGLTPVEVRLRNLIQLQDLPYTTAVGEIIDSGDFAKVLTRCCDAADILGFESRKDAASKKGHLLGLGVGMFAEWTGVGQLTEKVRLTLSRHGRLQVYMNVQDMGQGLRETLQKVAQARTGLPLDQIEIHMGDTRYAKGFGSFASRSAFVGGSALDAALEELIKKTQTYGSTVSEAISHLPDEAISLETIYTAEGASWPNGAHIVEVRIDPGSGFTSIERYTAVDDVGQPLYPSIVHGQILGGIAQGIGAALFEHVRYDLDSGQNITASFMDYALPRAEDIPLINSFLEESQPCRTNRLGAKGVGESGTVGAAHTILSAIRDALGSKEVLELPAWPERVWQWAQEA
jgi:aerobic carbon-monoxide dehydrogenase large subunit